jgi:adenine phosphoribosyltransferase
MNSEISSLVTRQIRVFPGYPIPGVAFQDLSGLYAHPGALARVAEHLWASFDGDADLVLGVEARGFVVGAAIAALASRPLVLARKPGKLPGPVVGVEYDLEYGSARLELQEDALTAGRRVVVVDDVLVTGGTASAAAELVRGRGAVVAGFGFVLELSGLGGAQRLAPARVVAAATVAP